jgi:ABC-2 type transport system permease protein
MKNLLYKEFHLVVHPLFYLVLLFGALLLIPEWVFFLVPMYFIFTTLPNLFSMAKAQNDIGFSAMLPIKRSDIVKARMISIVILEVMQIFVTAVFSVINLVLYPKGNFLLDPNVTYIGCVFVMFAIFNAVYFPLFYSTAYKIGLPMIAAMIVSVLFAAVVEMVMLFVPALKFLDGVGNIPAQLPVLIAGIVIFALLNVFAYKKSVKNFEKIDL